MFTGSANLKPGTYRIINVKGGTAIDVPNEDEMSVKSSIVDLHGNSNQQWTFERLGAGYSIRCVRNGAYLTINLRNAMGRSIEAGAYPVSWELQVFDGQNNIYWIGWPGSRAVFDLRGFGNPKPDNMVDLQDQRNPAQTCQLWRLVECEDTASRSLDEPAPSVLSDRDWDACSDKTTVAMAAAEQTNLNTNTVIDREGLGTGGDGETVITTTTTTVTRVRRLNNVG